ncbi:MAG: hypothetical protein GY861_24205 [bacterium]|nr:hypothetical protein [bacterium]
MTNLDRIMILLIAFIISISTSVFNLVRIKELQEQIKALETVGSPVIKMEKGTVYTEHSEFVVFDTDSLDIIENGGK